MMRNEKKSELIAKCVSEIKTKSKGHYNTVVIAKVCGKYNQNEQYIREITGLRDLRLTKSQ